MRYTMYVVVNDKGYYLTRVFRKGEQIGIDFLSFGPFVITKFRKAFADDHCEEFGGTVKEIEITVKD